MGKGLLWHAGGGLVVELGERRLLVQSCHPEQREGGGGSYNVLSLVLAQRVYFYR